MRLINDALAPDNYFLDVFAAVNSFDYYDRQGRFHSKMETREAWGKAFDTIRDTLGNAPTSSEAGGDHLIGHLDGADCQFLRLSPEARRYRSRNGRREEIARVIRTYETLRLENRLPEEARRPLREQASEWLLLPPQRTVPARYLKSGIVRPGAAGAERPRSAAALCSHRSAPCRLGLRRGGKHRRG